MTALQMEFPISIFFMFLNIDINLRRFKSKDDIGTS